MDDARLRHRQFVLPWATSFVFLALVLAYIWFVVGGGRPIIVFGILIPMLVLIAGLTLVAFVLVLLTGASGVLLPRTRKRFEKLRVKVQSRKARHARWIAVGTDAVFAMISVVAMLVVFLTGAEYMIVRPAGPLGCHAVVGSSGLLLHGTVDVYVQRPFHVTVDRKPVESWNTDGVVSPKAGGFTVDWSGATGVVEANPASHASAGAYLSGSTIVNCYGGR